MLAVKSFPLDVEQGITLARQPMCILQQENSLRYCWNH